MRAQKSELSAMKNRLERQTVHYEGRLKKAMDGIDILQHENNKLMKHNQQYEKCLVEGINCFFKNILLFNFNRLIILIVI